MEKEENNKIILIDITVHRVELNLEFSINRKSFYTSLTIPHDSFHSLKLAVCNSMIQL